jgi:hypothetical protein
VGHIEMLRALALADEVVGVARRAAGQAGSQRRRAALEVGVRAHHAVDIDRDAGVAHGQMLAAHGRQHGLVVDAGVRHQHTQRLEGTARARFDLRHRLGLAQALVCGDIETARIGDGRHDDALGSAELPDQAFQPLDA